jgi:hypothetical protein
VTMHCLIDWLSFTLDGRGVGGEDAASYGESAWNRCSEMLGKHWPTVICGQSFDFARGRAPYLFCLRRKDHGVSIFFDRRRTEILIEMSGVGCQTARLFASLEDLALDVSESVTRIDLTADITCDTAPKDFVAAGYSARFKSSGAQLSESGQTFYIGSWKSNRFARVYRYAAPHPRSTELRVEHVFRDESATSALSFLAENGLTGALAGCGEIFGWKHESWIPASAVPDDRMVANRDPKSDRDTVFWIYRSVVPALARLLAEHRLSWDDFQTKVSEEVTALLSKDVPSTGVALESDDE